MIILIDNCESLTVKWFFNMICQGQMIAYDIGYLTLTLTKIK